MGSVIDVEKCGKCGADFMIPLKQLPSYTIRTPVVVKSDNEFTLSCFARKYFKILFEISLWLILVITPILGAYFGYAIYEFIGLIVGLLVGMLVGFILVVQMGSLIATFLNIDSALEKLSDK